ncbi:MAG: phosphoglucosamine mutase [Elusimicrobiota bacterium]
MLKKIFGTDGIRGKAGEYPLTEELVRKLGYTSARLLKKTFPGQEKKVFLARDTRSSGQWLVSCLSEGLLSAGVNVVSVGILPTPALAHFVRREKCLAGVVVSASHNPAEYNGIKFFSPQGTKMADKLETEIEKYFFCSLRKTKVKSGRFATYAEADDEYLSFLKGTLSPAPDLRGLKVALDCAQGATYKVAPKIFTQLGAEVLVINNRPDGRNINSGCGALYPQQVAELVVREKADVGFAFDGDGDRVIAVDEKGNILDGDFILAIASGYFQRVNKLSNNGVVITVMANLGLCRFLEDRGIKYWKTAVGDRYVYEEMVKRGAVVGGEQSGHIIFGNYLPTGDGLLTALQIMAISGGKGKPFSSWSKLFSKYPQILVNLEWKSKKDPASYPSIKTVIQKNQKKLGEQGRVFVRLSGTEPLVRIMLEGEKKEEIKNMANEIAREIEKVTESEQLQKAGR